jgi:hypothetical protein
VSMSPAVPAVPAVPARRTRLRRLAWPALLAVAVLVPAACAEGGAPSDLASRTASRTASVATDRPESTRDAEPTAEPTRDDDAATESSRDEGGAAEPTRDDDAGAAEPTRDEDAGAEPTSVRTVERTVERTVVQSVVPTPPQAAPTQIAAETDETGDGTPTWAWWLLVAALVALAAGAWLMQRRSRRREWDRGMAAAAGEATWVARRLVTELAQIPTPQQRALTWGAGSERVGALEDRLAGLAATASEPEAAGRAQALGEAVRRAHIRLDQIVVADDTAGLTDQLWATARDLEEAVARSQPATAAPATAL